jgi:hypothetical protein
MDISFRHPFTCCVAGATRCGKTEWVKRFVQNCHLMMDVPPDKIIWCYAEFQPGYNELNKIPNLEFIEGIPDMNKLKNPGSKLVIFDDLMSEFGKNKKSDLTQLFTRGCHHWNCSAIHIVQNLFFENLRNARINSHYLVLLRNPSDKLQIMNLGRQLFPQQQKFFMNAYTDACTEPYSYLLIDMNPLSSDEIRLRTAIFPSELSFAYLPK